MTKGPPRDAAGPPGAPLSRGVNPRQVGDFGEATGQLAKPTGSAPGLAHFAVALQPRYREEAQGTLMRQQAPLPFAPDARRDELSAAVGVFFRRGSQTQQDLPQPGA